MRGGRIEFVVIPAHSRVLPARAAILFGAIAVLATLIAAPAGAQQPIPTHAPDPRFEVVGHDPLYSRGMNAAPALYGHHLYVGNRTDGLPNHPHPGVLVVDVADPSKPSIVGEIGPPNQGTIGETSRELRVWPRRKLLMTMNFVCSPIIHACASTAESGVSHVTPTLRFYDLAAPATPVLAATYTPSRTPHEMFLWEDPHNPDRALLFMSTPSSSTDAARPNLIVTDISKAREGTFKEIALWNGNPDFPQEAIDADDVRLHSIGVSVDGTRTYLAYLGGGFLVLDSSDVALGKPNPALRLRTAPADRVHWGNPGAHSAVKVPGRRVALVTDEVYGDVLDPVTGNDHGCPWGWVRMISILDEAKPRLVSEFKLPENERSSCTGVNGIDPQNSLATSYSSHNPTLLRNIAFVTWHSSGLIAMSLEPAHPRLLARFQPEPLGSVSTEDPALGLGRNKVIMWSYPIISNGLIYVIDLRNGLYVLRYHGPFADEVAHIGFLEGNS
ncbi:MAG: LVIVD repeat-containing protein, partial [Actinomycetota bacterium]